MKQNISIFLSATFLLFSGCSPAEQESSIELGAEKASAVWIYLCGLTKDMALPREVEHRAMLDAMGKKFGIKFLAVVPPTRCPEYNDMLCWPHETDEDMTKTYDYILSKTGGRPIAGFIGFSNGGFFLNRLVQQKELGVPVISVGGSGYLAKALPNRLYLVVGKQDGHHFDDMRAFYAKAEGTSLQAALLEHEGGHIMPQEIIERILEQYRSGS